MKDHSSRHACPDGKDCTSPPVRNNAKGEHRYAGQQGDFDKSFHHLNMRLPWPVFQLECRPQSKSVVRSLRQFQPLLATLGDALRDGSHHVLGLTFREVFGRP